MMDYENSRTEENHTNRADKRHHRNDHKDREMVLDKAIPHRDYRDRSECERYRKYDW